MKRFTKVCLIICGVLAAFGIFFCVIGAMFGFGYQQLRTLAREGVFQIGSEDFHLLDIGIGNDLDEIYEDIDDEYIGTTDQDYTSFTQSFPASEVNNLDIQYGYGTLVFQPSDSENIEVSVEYKSLWKNHSQHHRRNVSCQMDGDTLEIEDSIDKAVFRLFSNFSDDAKNANITIKIPKGKVFHELELESGAGHVTIETALKASVMDISLGAGEVYATGQSEETLHADELSVEIGAGRMELSGIQAKEMDVDCGTGEMDLSGVTAHYLNVDCGVGSIFMNMTDEQEEYDYNVDCGIGQVKIGDSSYSGLGRSKQIRNNGNGQMDIDCGIGQIEISFEK